MCGGIWEVHRGRGGTGLFGESGEEEGIWKVQRSRGAYRVFWEYPSGRNHLEDLGRNMMKLLKQMCKK